MASAGVKVHPIPRRLEGKEFLASSHFRIGYDGRLARDTGSTFTKDFPPRDPRLSRRDPMSEPDPAHIMHTDPRNRVPGESTAKDTFSKYTVERPEFKSATAGYTTNFKMHSDDSIARKFNFHTTHLDDFRALNLAEAKRTMNQAFTTKKSYVPEGDKTKEKTTHSEYGSSFRGDPRTIPEPTPRVRNALETISGDPRTQRGQFVTTSFRAYNGLAHQGFRPPSPIRPVPPMDVSSIPQGDRQKAECPASMQQQSYQPKQAREFQPYNKSDVVAHIGATTFRLGTSDRNGMMSTTDATYPAHTQSGRQQPMGPTYRNVSSFPEGDTDLVRQINRLRDTTTKEFHPKIADDHYYANHVSGANLRTHSNVHLGMIRGRQFYDTSMRGSYPSYNAGYRYVAPVPTTVNIPLNHGYGTEQSTSRTTYLQDSQKDRLRHSDPGSYNDLKKSHWTINATSHSSFLTEHTTQFTPKPNVSKGQIDTGRLHRSTIPLGSQGRPGELLYY